MYTSGRSHFYCFMICFVFRTCYSLAALPTLRVVPTSKSTREVFRCNFTALRITGTEVTYLFHWSVDPDIRWTQWLCSHVSFFHSFSVISFHHTPSPFAPRSASWYAGVHTGGRTPQFRAVVAPAEHSYVASLQMPSESLATERAKLMNSISVRTLT